MRSPSMKASPARLWDSDTALAGESQLSYIKVLARSAPWNARARVPILPTQGDLPSRVEALDKKCQTRSRPPRFRTG